MCVNSTCLLTPIGKGFLNAAMTFIVFYVVVCPFTFTFALTDLLTESITQKMVYFVQTGRLFFCFCFDKEDVSEFFRT